MGSGAVRSSQFWKGSLQHCYRALGSGPAPHYLVWQRHTMLCSYKYFIVDSIIYYVKEVEIKKNACKKILLL